MKKSLVGWKSNHHARRGCGLTYYSIVLVCGCGAMRVCVQYNTNIFGRKFKTRIFQSWLKFVSHESDYRSPCHVEDFASRLADRKAPPGTFFSTFLCCCRLLLLDRILAICILKKTMKFYTALLLLTIGQASAFSAVAPPKASSPVSASEPPIDRSMKGIDSDASTFDPTEGDSPALKRNNNDGVWVSQVRHGDVLFPFLALSLLTSVRWHGRIVLIACSPSSQQKVAGHSRHGA